MYWLSLDFHKRTEHTLEGLMLYPFHVAILFLSQTSEEQNQVSKNGPKITGTLFSKYYLLAQ